MKGINRFSFIPDCGIATLEFMAKRNHEKSGFDHTYFGHSLFDDPAGSDEGVFKLSATPIQSQRATLGYQRDSAVTALLRSSGLQVEDLVFDSPQQLLEFASKEVASKRVAYIPYAPKGASKGEAHGGYQSMALVDADSESDSFSYIDPTGPGKMSREALLDGLCRASAACGGIARSLVLHDIGETNTPRQPDMEDILSMVRTSVNQWDESVCSEFLSRISERIASAATHIVFAPRIWTIVYQRKQSLVFFKWAGLSPDSLLFRGVETAQKGWQSVWFLAAYYHSRGSPPNGPRLIGAFRDALAAEVEFRRSVEKFSFAPSLARL